MSIVYLASPYTSHASDPSVKTRIEEERYQSCLDQVRFSLDHAQHFTVYSPVLHYHPVAVKHGLPGDYAFWKRHNDDLLAVASEVWVLCLKGWKESKGVAGEVAYAESLGKNIIYVYPEL